MSFEYAVAIALGLALDLVIGDPRKMPHLVRLVGWMAVKGETVCVRVFGRSVAGGAALWVGIVVSCFGLYLAVGHAVSLLHPWAKVGLDALLVFQCVAFRDLKDHVLAVEAGLKESLESGRARVAWIVSRDTDRMEEADVCRATIESGAENVNDAVIAPLFWAAIFGPGGALLFRIANTLDAMVGHRNERFEKLGKFSARLDDVMNFAPARLCSLLLLTWKDAARWRRLRSDARKHPSVNAGWPEAAMARRLGVVIGGRMYAGGQLVQTAEMNEGAPQPTPRDIRRSVGLMGVAYGKAIALVALAWSVSWLIGS